MSNTQSLLPRAKPGWKSPVCPGIVLAAFSEL
jgi:hypothetical protein